MYKNKKITIVSHVLVWLLLFCLPYLLSYGQEQEIYRLIAHFWIPLVFSLMIFYFNYFVLIDRFLFPKKMLPFVILNGLMIILFVFLKEYIEDNFFQELLRKSTRSERSVRLPFKMAIYMQLLSYMAPLLFSIALKTTKRWSTIEAERKEASHFKLKSELQHLHYQLQPHFFFNSLNNIYSMVDVSPEQAKSSIHSLSKLMRYLLYETNLEMVPLAKEIDFLKKYINLMALRVSDNTTIHSSFPLQETGIQIAPLLFVSLIENAFKHGVSATKQSRIDISMSCENKRVLFTVENNNYPKKTDDKSGSGIGLQNLEKRLELLYADKFSFTRILKDNRFLVTLKIETN
ncbi:sensor histidine kinase [Flavicella sediminum]|uniref:sensor histidine kinase n=1 Tax=Flavicella sediminum TaxID=2585141 RepID=UPI00112491D9|nr:histidine kinase [Flavicella sediminum]